jgi:predicted ester cyclase
MQSHSLREIAVRSVQIMGAGTLEDFREIVHPEFLNHEDKDEPPETRGRGPEPAYRTALWLRAAFAELRWEVHEAVCEGDLVVVHCTMSGRHVRPFAEYDAGGQVREVFPPTGRRFASTQTHWLRVSDGQVIEHWANRDDIGMAMQLGWVPPTPLYMLRAALAKRRVRRAAARPRRATAAVAALMATGAALMAALPAAAHNGAGHGGPDPVADVSARVASRGSEGWGSTLRPDGRPRARRARPLRPARVGLEAQPLGDVRPVQPARELLSHAPRPRTSPRR